MGRILEIPIRNWNAGDKCYCKIGQDDIRNTYKELKPVLAFKRAIQLTKY